MISFTYGQHSTVCLVTRLTNLSLEFIARSRHDQLGLSFLRISGILSARGAPFKAAQTDCAFEVCTFLSDERG